MRRQTRSKILLRKKSVSTTWTNLLKGVEDSSELKDFSSSKKIRPKLSINFYKRRNAFLPLKPLIILSKLLERGQNSFKNLIKTIFCINLSQALLILLFGCLPLLSSPFLGNKVHFIF